jgi:hypothetical protein
VRRLLALSILALVVAACGGAARLSRAEFAKREDAICSRYARAVQALGQPKTLAELARFTAKVVPLTEAVVTDARKLKPPRDEQKLAKEWNAENQKVVDAVKRLDAAARAGDRAAAKAALDDANAANARSNELGKQLGMSACTKS